MSWWNKYVGLPFIDKGRGEKGGDCWNLVMQVYKNELGIELPSYDEEYEDTHDKGNCARIVVEEKSKWIDVDKPQEFDVIITRIRGVPMHVGIVTKVGSMLHCSQGIGTVHEKYTSTRWKTNIIGFARHESVGNICITTPIQQ